MLPIATVASETGDLVGRHRSDLAQADFGHHSLEPSSDRGAGSGDTKVVVDDLNLRPTQNREPLAHRILKASALAVVDDLVGGRLPDVEYGFALEVMRLDFVT